MTDVDIVSPAPAPISESWVDLAANAPGAAVRERARAEWDEYHARRPVASTVARFLKLRTPDVSWAEGADGEELVGERLARLRSAGWFVLHSVPIGSNGADVDHLLIGPGGVFTINTKNHARANVWVGDRVIMVNGKKTDHLRNARTEGQRVSTVLTRETPWTVTAQPAIIIVTQKYTVKGHPEHVLVLRTRDVPNYFQQLPRIYSDESVEWIYDTARRSTIWA